MADTSSITLSNGDVRTILSASGLAQLRTAWNLASDALTNAAHGAVVAPYPPAGDPFNALGDHAYGRNDAMPPKQRERCVISVLTAKDLETGFLLPIHFYWALMEGLEPAEIAETVFLAGMYSGIANYLSSISRFQSVLQLLSELVEKKDKLEPLAVFDQIRRQFSYLNQRTAGNAKSDGKPEG